MRDNPELEAVLRHQGLGKINVWDSHMLLSYAVTHLKSNRSYKSVSAIDMLAGVRGVDRNVGMAQSLFSHVHCRDSTRGQRTEGEPVDSRLLLLPRDFCKLSD